MMQGGVLCVKYLSHDNNAGFAYNSPIENVKQ